MHIINSVIDDRSRCGPGAPEPDCNATVVGSISTRENQLLFLNIFISSFGVEFHHSTRNCSKNTKLPLPSGVPRVFAAWCSVGLDAL